MKHSTVQGFRMLVTLLLAVGFLSPSGYADEVVRVEALERDFATATDLSLLHSLKDLPEEERGLFLNSGLLRGGIAEFGELWNTTDAGRQGIPRRQFLFAGLSERLLAIAYLEGSFGGPVLQLYLKYRGTHRACFYDFGKPPHIFALKVIQAYFSDARLEKPDCLKLSG